MNAGRVSHLIVPLVAFVSVVFTALPALAGEKDKAKIVVVLDPDANDGRPGSTLVDRGLRAGIAAYPGNVEVFTEHLDVLRFPDADYQKTLANYLQRKYATRKVDLVVTWLGSGLDFALQGGARLFPGVPIIFGVLDEREAQARKLPPDVIGVPIKFDLAATLDVALQLHPQSQRVYVITGKSTFDVAWADEARRAFRAHESKVELIHLAGLPMPALLKQVADLPEHSLIYYVHIFQDGDDRILIPAEALKLISAQANAPVYSHVDTFVGRGIVGGRVFSFEAAGKDAARLGVRILVGERPEKIGIQETAVNGYQFDWRQLQRWGISVSNLPPGSIVHNHVPTFWELYRWRILGVISLCIIEALLIVGLLVQRASRRGAERRLQQSQNELQKLTGQLIQAQESERRRIARELHDDLSQNLAVLSVELDMLARLQQSPPEGRIQALSVQVKQISSNVHGLSHQLHPAKLEQLGLVTAVISLCKELSQSHGLKIAVSHQNVPEQISNESALCLYRITQESLNNVIKHSGARQATVELNGDGDFISLRVIDDGNGFDANSAHAKGGLGLVGMRERLRLVDGEISIDSRPAGTRIEVRIPKAAASCVKDSALQERKTPVG